MKTEFSSKKESLLFKKIKKLTEKGAIRKSRYIRKANLYHPFFLLQGSLILSGYSKLRESNQIYALHAFDYDNPCYVGQVEIKGPFYSVPILPQHQGDLEFLFRGKLFQSTCLPNGLSLGPRKFTELLKPPLTFLRKLSTIIVAYIDLFLGSPSFM